MSEKPKPKWWWTPRHPRGWRERAAQHKRAMPAVPRSTANRDRIRPLSVQPDTERSET